MGKYSIDRVIGMKECRKCGYPVSVESYSVPEAKERLERHTICQNMIAPYQLAELRDYRGCGHHLFSDPKFEVKMKPYKEWLNPLLRRMNK